jgi:osmoprotectant transport system permease protein
VTGWLRSRARLVLLDYKWAIILLAGAALFRIFQSLLTAVGSRIANVIGAWVLAVVSTRQLQQYPGFFVMRQDWVEFSALFGAHLSLVIDSVGAAVLTALPIGFVLHRFPRLYLPAFVLLDAVYTIPSLSVFPVLVKQPAFGISYTTVIVVVVAYAQFILARNVFAGLDSVPSEVKESARGMGMSRLQILLHIEFPLALPVIVAGLRNATVAAIAIVSIGAYTGIADLGQYFFSFGRGGFNPVGEIDAGAVGVVVLALGADMLLRLAERFVPANRVARAESRRVASAWPRWRSSLPRNRRPSQIGP